MADFAQFETILDHEEGGYVNNPNDAGGCTNHGVILATLQTYRNDPSLTCADVQALTLTEADAIAKALFWDKIMGDQINSQQVAEIFFDCYWGQPGSAVAIMQGVLNGLGANPQLTVDNGMGPKTLAAINAADPDALSDAYRNARADYYNYKANNLAAVPDDWAAFFQSIGATPRPADAEFLQGWLNRLENFPWLTDAAAAVNVVADTISDNPAGVSIVTVFFC